MSNRLKKIIEEGFTYSTIHGLPNIATNKHVPIKILWTVCLLVSTGVCSFLIITGVMSYLEYDVISKVSIFNEVTSPFPTISICNIYPYVNGNSSNFVRNTLIEQNFSQFLNYSDNGLSLEPNKFLTNYLSLINGVKVSNEEKKSYSLTLDEMLISCLYASTACNASDFEWYYDTLYGNCYMFNKGSNSSIKMSTNTGKWNGLRLELYVGSINELEVNQQSSGAHIFIHNHTIKPNSYSGIDVSTSTNTNIAVSRMFFKKLSLPYSDCVSASDSIYYKFLVDLNGKYRYRDCIMLCFQREVIENCKCRDVTLPTLDTATRMCLNNNDLTGCLYPLFTNFSRWNMEEVCPYCKYECETVLYGYSSSFNEYPSEEYGNFLLRLNKIKAKNVTNFDQLKRNVLSLNIYYDDLQYRLVEEVPAMDLFTLISNVGGTLGLFLGMSFLSFLEIAELLLEIILLKIDIYKERKVTNLVKINENAPETPSQAT